jgi:uncharacterized repeat protein (TIGR03803 family)
MNVRSLGVLALVAASLAAFSAASCASAAGYKEKVLYGFCDQCSDGYVPRSWLYEDPSGNLFGTTEDGGHANGGTIYELVFDAAKQKYSHSVLHKFCSKKDCTDGGGTVSGLIADESGNLYGTTINGGTHGSGTVYELSFDQIKDTWSYSVLYDFCAKTNCPDGSTPDAGLIVDQSGNFYGTTHDGGTNNFGTVYELVFDQAKQKWTEQVLYNFSCETDSCPQGASPTLGLFMDENGDLFGATPFGVYSGGNVFEMTFDQAKQKWVYRDIYDFCPNTGCDDGSVPSGRLIEDSTGNLYSTTASGGVHGGGTVYSLSPFKKGWRHSVLYNFCVDETCSDGRAPSGTLYMDMSQDIFGTTGAGGANTSGTVYELSLDPNTRQWGHSILYSFCVKQNCADGSIPGAGVIHDTLGDLFGTTNGGGGGTFGTVFELTPRQ